MLKDILVHLPIGSSCKAVANYAVSVARQFDSHLTGVAVAYRPVVSGMTYGAIPADVIAWQQQEAERLANAACRATPAICLAKLHAASIWPSCRSPTGKIRPMTT